MDVMAQTYSQTINSSDGISKGGTHRMLCLYDLHQKGRGQKILLVADALSAGAEWVGLHPHPQLTRHGISSSCPESLQNGFWWYYLVIGRVAHFSVSGSDGADS